MKLAVEHGADGGSAVQVAFDDRRNFGSAEAIVPDVVGQHEHHRAVAALSETAAALNFGVGEGVGAQGGENVGRSLAATSSVLANEKASSHNRV